MDCRIRINKNDISVMAPNGNESKLFWNIAAQIGNINNAIEIYDYINNPEFQERVKEVIEKENGEGTFETVLDSNGEIPLTLVDIPITSVNTAQQFASKHNMNVQGYVDSTNLVSKKQDARKLGFKLGREGTSKFFLQHPDGYKLNPHLLEVAPNRGAVTHNNPLSNLLTEHSKNKSVLKRDDIVKIIREHGNQYSNQLLMLIEDKLSANLELHFEDNPNRHGGYNTKTKKIFISNNSNQKESTLMHELVHDATIHTLFKVRDGHGTKEEVEAAKYLAGVYQEFLDHKAIDRGRGLHHHLQAEDDIAEFIANAMTDPDTQAYMRNKYANVKLSLWDRFVIAIQKMLGIKTQKDFRNGKDTGQDLLARAVLGSTMLINAGTQNMSSYEGEFNRLNTREYQFYTQNQANMSAIQKKVMNDILKVQARYELKADGSKYIDMTTNSVLDRVSDRLDTMPGPTGQPAYYGFNQDYDDGRYDKNKEWGNQTDMILEGIILGKSFDTVKNEIVDYQKNMQSASKISDQVLKDTWESMQKFILDQKTLYPGITFMSQITMGNEDTGVAGTMDLIGIKSDGTVIIYDLKTSEKTTVKPFKTISLAGEEVSNSYTKRFPNSSSKKERHAAQLSFYKAFMNSKGIVVSNTSIIALKLGENEAGGDPQTSAKIEKVHNLDTIKTIVKANAYDTGYNSAYAAGQSLSQLESTVQKIQLVLQERLNKYLSEKHESGARFIRHLQETIAGLEEVKAIEEFVNEAHNTVVGTKDPETGKVIWAGYYTIAKEKVAQIHTGKLSGLEAINELYTLKDILEMYDGTLNDVRQHYNMIDKTENPDAGSTIDKLRDLRDITEERLPALKEELNTLAAKLLASVAQKADPAVQKAIEDMKRATNLRIADHRADQKIIEAKNPNYQEDKIWKRKQGYIDNLRNKLEENIRKLTVDYDTIKYQLDNGADKDIGIVEAFFTPGIQNSNSVIALYVKLLKDEFEANRYHAIEQRKAAETAFTNYLQVAPAMRDRPSEFNKGIYTVMTIPRNNEEGQSQHYAFISEIDYEAFERNKAAMFKRTAEIEDSDTRKGVRKSWFAANQERIPWEDTIITNPITGKPVVLHMGEKSMKEYLKRTLAPAEYKRKMDELEANDILPREFVRPRMRQADGTPMYMNAKYEELSRDKEKKDYHDYLLATFIAAQDELPPLYNEYEKYFIPTRLKSSKEKVLTDPKGLGKYMANRFNKRAEDVEEYGTEKDEIPVMFRYNTMPLEDVSLDLIRSVMEFEEQAMKYKTRKKMLALSRHLLENFQENMPAETNTSGKPILKKASTSLEEVATNLGIPNFNYYMRKHNSYLAAMMEGLVDMHIYGKFKKRQVSKVPLIGTTDWGKWADGLIRFSSLTQIGLTNPLLGVSNSLMAEAQVLIEAFAGKHYNKTDWAWAEAFYDKSIPGMMNDFSKPVNKSFLGQLIDLYDPLQGEFLDAMGRKLSSSAYSKLISTNSWYWMMRQGEHHAQVKSLIAMLRSQKVLHNGQEISLIDAYELDSKGEIKLKEGVQPLDEADGLVSSSVKNKLHSINKGMHGNYNAFDRVLAERDAFGRLLTMYRKFVVTGFKRRYDPIRRDEEQEDVVEGYYRTFYRILFNDFKLIMKGLVPGNNYSYKERLTDLERENLRRACAEFMFIMMTGTALMSYTYMPPPDENNEYANDLIHYEIMRLNSELGFFMGPGDPRALFMPNPLDTYRMFKTPVISIGTINKALRLFMQLHNPGERYQRDEGIAEKGDLKMEILFYKLLGINGYASHPDQAIKVLQLQLN